MSTITTPSAPISNDLMAAVNNKPASTAAPGSVEADTDKFMTLLVTQLKNQDPMNPLDNAQITSQLAQLSTVTGVNKLNTTLESLKSSYQASESLQAANMIGHGVLTAGTDLTLAKTADNKLAGIMGVDLATPADSVQVEIRNAAGKLVHTIDLGAQPAGTLPLGWDGASDELDSAGKPLMMAPGQYRFAVTATRGGEPLTDAAALTFGTVASVSTNAQGVKLNVPSLGAISMADVRQIL
ncbi:MAG: flagellar hook assembly protein FlgD [Pseudomonadota bacterium]